MIFVVFDSVNHGVDLGELGGRNGKSTHNLVEHKQREPFFEVLRVLESGVVQRVLESNGEARMPFCAGRAIFGE